MEAMKIKTKQGEKEYIPVNERIKYFRTNEKYEGYALETEIVNLDLDRGLVVMKAVVKDKNDRIVATAFASEDRDASYINSTSFIENADTSVVGRVLGMLGIGIDTSIATAEEVKNAIQQQESNEQTYHEKMYNLDLRLGEVVQFSDGQGNPVNYVFKFSKKTNKYFYMLENEADEYRSSKFLKAEV